MASVSSDLDWTGLANKGLIIWPQQNVFLHDQSGKSRLNKLGSFFNYDGDGNERLAKKKKLCTWCSTLCNVKFPDRKFCGGRNNPMTNFSFSFSTMGSVPKIQFQKTYINYIWRFKRVEIISIKKGWKTQRPFIFKCDAFRCDRPRRC